MGVGAKGKGPRLAGEKASQERASSSSDPDAAYDDWVIAQFEKKYARGKKKPAPGWLGTPRAFRALLRLRSTCRTARRRHGRRGE